MFGKIINFKVPFLFRLIGVCFFIGFALSISINETAALLGCLCFLIINIAISSKVASFKIRNNFLSVIFDIIGEKSLGIAYIVSGVFALWGAIAFLVGGDSDRSMGITLVMFPIITMVMVKIRLKASNYDETLFNTLKCWLPFALSPVLAVFAGTYLAANIGLGIVICALIVGFMIFAAIIASPNFSSHHSDTSSSGYMFTSNYIAKWSEGPYQKVDGNDINYEGTVTVTYEGEADTYDKSEAELQAIALVSKYEEALAKDYPNKTINKNVKCRYVK